jgi:hypothetical protein
LLEALLNFWKRYFSCCETVASVAATRPSQKRITISSCDLEADPALLRVTGGELFDRIVEKGSYSEKDAADLIKQVKTS